MIGQITPLVQVASKRLWWRSVAAHTVGATGSSLVLGLFLGCVGVILHTPDWRALATMGVGLMFVYCALKEAGVIPWPLPAFRRQTPKRFMCAFGPIWAAFAWGLDLGQGWTTYIEFYGYYALLAFGLLSGNPLASGTVVTAYGLGRALPVIAAGLAPGHSASGPLGAGYITYYAAIRRINAAALAFVGAYVLVGTIV